MQINLDQLPICVINLPHRTERLKRTHLQLNEFFKCDKEFNVMPGIVDRQPMKGIAQSHMNCIQLAKDNKWPYVIIVEDDVHFQSKQSKEYANECMMNVPDDFEILCSGIYTGADLKPINNHWNKVTEFSGLHFYIVNEIAYDKILAFNKDQHIDRWLGKTNGCNLKCYVASNFFAIQFDGFSDNVQQEMQYSYLLKKFKVLK